MRRLGGLTGSAFLALCILGAAACGDDNKDKPETAADGGPLADGGAGLGMDGSLVPPRLDGATFHADGAIISEDGSIVGQVNDTGVPGSMTDGAVAPPVGCPAGCDDRVDCTIDRCVDGVCTHSIDNSVCQGSASCTLTMGCQTSAKTCMVAADCADTDPCTTNLGCLNKICKTAVTDVDGDGNPTPECGGTDCDDTNGFVNVTDTESCDGLDNNCDKLVDNGATCGAGESCTAGHCVCAAGFTQCGGQFNDLCVDTKTDPAHCGGCNGPTTDCGSGGICTNGGCSCPPASGTMCGNSCPDVKSSQSDCGGCGMNCQSTQQQPRSCLDGACTACGAENQACCSSETVALDPASPPANSDGCVGALKCQGTRGAPDAKCVCGAGSVQCQGVCTDITTDRANCGGCGQACSLQPPQACVPNGGSGTCAPCGQLTEACCVLRGVPFCLGGATCNTATDVCVHRAPPTPVPAN
ncbi:MAG: Tryptophan synthase alpha chain [Myxococcaceae bacterium]|nr:Tryptophan synthase alpha chain [Myxococcaceae bacterium]